MSVCGTKPGSSLQLLLQACLLCSGAAAQQQPLSRVFVADTEERYAVTMDLKAETHSVRTESVAAQTFVTPVVRAAEVSVTWRTTRRILAAGPGGQAKIEESEAPNAGRCEQSANSDEADPELLAAVMHFCSSLLHSGTVRYSEDRAGLLHEETPDPLPDLGEDAPPLLGLWLRRALRPNVIFPAMPFVVGVKSQHRLHPSGGLLKSAEGSETSEWLEARERQPAITLHVVQQLSWEATPPPASTGTPRGDKVTQFPAEESFFADSLTTLSVADGSVVRARRSASRSALRKMDPIQGLPHPPEFSSKLTLSITMERLP